MAAQRESLLVTDSPQQHHGTVMAAIFKKTLTPHHALLPRMANGKQQLTGDNCSSK